MSRAQKVLLLSARVGAGHKRAADAIAASIRQISPETAVEHWDALEYSNVIFRNSFLAAYSILVNRCPTLWRKIYEDTERKAAGCGMGRLSARSSHFHAGHLLRSMRAFAPDRIICTHFMPAEVMAIERRKKRLNAKLSVVLTDYEIHPVWIQAGVDSYFVATPGMEHNLRAKGVGKAGITVSGIPLFPQFSQEAMPKVLARQNLGLEAERPTVLLAFGGLGWEALDRIAVVLIAAFPEVRFLAVAGSNKKMLTLLQGMARSSMGHITPYGYVSNMHELMYASDLIVTKCGGLTASECLAVGLPMVIFNPIPGQEERNADYLLAGGMAARAHSISDLVYNIKALLAEPDRLPRMSRAAHAMAHPHAAQKVAEAILAVD